MANITNRTALMAFFDQHSQLKKDLNARSKKYVVYNYIDSDRKIYVGGKGAVRTGKTIAGSIPMHAGYRNVFIKRGKKILEN